VALLAAGALVAACRLRPGHPGADGVTDLQGRPADPLAGNPSATATVLVFVATDCPISNRYAPELRRLSDRYAPQGVVFRLVYPTARESLDAIRDHAREYALPFAAYHDPRHAVAARAKATVTPEAAVFTRAGELVYHGRIDDRAVDFGETRLEPTRRDLEEAIDAALAGRAPAETFAPAIGCAISG
jgi:hypothetical protein